MIDFREGRSPSLTYTPPPLIKGRNQGDRLEIISMRHAHSDGKINGNQV
jgi:hypothetical protein